jgi:hypothetical protein
MTDELRREIRRTQDSLQGLWWLVIGGFLLTVLALLGLR